MRVIHDEGSRVSPSLSSLLPPHSQLELRDHFPSSSLLLFQLFVFDSLLPRRRCGPASPLPLLLLRSALLPPSAGASDV